jgi:hypothetical protein
MENQVGRKNIHGFTLDRIDDSDRHYRDSGGDRYPSVFSLPDKIFQCCGTGGLEKCRDRPRGIFYGSMELTVPLLQAL